MSHREEVPITGRKRFVGVNRAQEQRLGKAAFEQLKVEQKRNVVMDNKKEIERILARLSKESGIPEFQDMKWNVMVLRNPTPNAFVLPGGYCVVHTGIFQVAKNVDGLATVLSHEAAHVLARHGAERMSSGFILMPLVLLVSSVFSLPVTWVQAVAQLLLMLPNSRLQESEAGNGKGCECCLTNINTRRRNWCCVDGARLHLRSARSSVVLEALWEDYGAAGGAD